MRNVIDLQMRLGEQAIGAIELDAESRDDIPQILRGLHLPDVPHVNCKIELFSVWAFFVEWNAIFRGNIFIFYVKKCSTVISKSNHCRIEPIIEPFQTGESQMAAHVLTGTMSSPKYSPQHYRGLIIHHLGLVAAMYDELGIGEAIDRVIVQNDLNRIVSIGQAVKAMVLNGLGFANRALYLTPLFFEDKPVNRLIGAGIEAEHLNDDVLGRALDDMYDYSLDILYSQIAASTVKRLELSARFGHFDSTGFHVDGKYNSGEEPEEGVVHITKGYSRDHRPDLHQICLQLICERQAGIPLLMKPLSGNNDDKTSFRETINAHIEQMKNSFGVKYMIADSAFYTANTLELMGKDNLWISRVPETLNLSTDVIHAVAPDLMSALGQSSHISLGVQYSNIKQRWVVVYSPEAYQRGIKTV
ncbi:MAG: protein of unknown function (DUF4277), partial [Candidatus Kentron sp. G]